MTNEEMLAKLTQHIDDKHRDTVDLVQQAIKASEVRGDQKLDQVKTEILIGVGEFFDEHVVSKLDDHENRIVILEEKTKV